MNGRRHVAAGRIRGYDAMHLRVDLLYGSIGIAYLFAILGLEKNVVFGLLAVGYLLLASKHRNAKC
jgi:hypothetical protein